MVFVPFADLAHLKIHGRAPRYERLTRLDDLAPPRQIAGNKRRFIGQRMSESERPGATLLRQLLLQIFLDLPAP